MGGNPAQLDEHFPTLKQIAAVNKPQHTNYRRALHPTLHQSTGDSADKEHRRMSYKLRHVSVPVLRINVALP